MTIFKKRLRIIGYHPSVILSLCLILWLLSLRVNEAFVTLSTRSCNCGYYSSSTRIAASSPQRSCVEFTDPLTGCEVVLVGCFHGSPSSAADVKREIQAKRTDVIALELCASRFADLRKDVPKSPDPIDPSRLLRFLSLVVATTQKKGMSTGIATGVLGSVSGLQTALSGFTPGLEFTTALELSQESEYKCDLVLADQAVDETIENVGRLPYLVKIMLQEVISGSSSSLGETQWCLSAKALSTSVGGDPSLKPEYQVSVPQVITRNSAVIYELLRLMVPPIVATQLSLSLINWMLFSGNSPSGSIPSADASIGADADLVAFTLTKLTAFDGITFPDPIAWILNVFPHAILLGFFLTAAYALVAVPVTKVILSERDDHLARGIQAACRLAAGEHGRHGRVVAVLGLLHINGITQRMLQAQHAHVNDRLSPSVEKIS